MHTLSQYLKATGMTQGDFAASVRTTQANISKLCGDDPKISPELAVEIEKVTGGLVRVESWPRFAVLASRIAADAPLSEAS